MEENLITWNVPNWITVLLMVTVGFAVLAAMSQFYKNWKAKQGMPA